MMHVLQTKHHYSDFNLELICRTEKLEKPLKKIDRFICKIYQHFVTFVVTGCVESDLQTSRVTTT